MTDVTGDLTYLVLADRASPYLLARVRWPDVAQAITVGSPDWLDDPGLFDLPYDASAVAVSFPQAASVAAAWGRQLRPEPEKGAPSFIRRMPANWSDLSAAERRALGIESVRNRRASARALRRLRSAQASLASPSQADGHIARPDGGDDSQTAAQANGNGRVPPQRRPPARVRVDGRALIRSRDITMSAGLVDLSEGGMECVLPEVRPAFALGAKLSGPFLLELQGTTERICLDVPGWIAWQRSTGTSTYFGVTLGALSEAQSDGVQRFLASAVSKESR